MKNKKKLIAVALATVMGLSYTSYPVYAQEEIKTNVSNPVENVNAQEQNSKINEIVTKQNETTKSNKLTNEVKMYADNNAGSFNVTGDTSGTEWTYDSSANTLTFKTSGIYTVTGDGTQTSEKIIVSDNFNGTITIENINISADCAFEVKNSANLTLNLSGNNILTSSLGAGLQFSGDGTGKLIIESSNNGSLTAKGHNFAAGIGGGMRESARNITINSGIVNSTSYYGAGIGGGYSKTGTNIIINGGTVTATSKFGAGIGNGQAEYDNSNIIITGGSVKSSSFSSAPTDGNNHNVYLARIVGLSGVDNVIVDGNQDYSRNGDHPDDGAFYLYLTGENHTVTANGNTYKLYWNDTRNTLQQDNIMPEVTVASTTATSITVQPLADTYTYGEAEYSINNKDWQSSNEFTGLKADTEYTVYARYKGNDTYIQSKVGSIAVTTMKDGSTLIKEPSELTATYGQKLLDISLDNGWTWANGDTPLSVGDNTYSARFDTTKYEDEYDFTGVDGYDSTHHYVERSLAVYVSKADTTLVIKTNMDKAYDGKAVNEPSVSKVGSSKNVTFTWYQSDEQGVWTLIESAPVNVGSYKVVASVEADDNYNGAEIEMEFEITKAQPSYTLPTDLVIKQGESLSTLGLPDGFTWKDDTQTANTLGTQTFKAVFTPEDTTNYQTVEVDIRVDVVPTLILVNHVPTISADDKVVTAGDKFELMKDVTASDKEDGDLTNKVKVINSHVDTSKAGTYEVTYKVVDSQGAGATKTITVTVKEKTDSQTSNNGSSGTVQTNQNDKTQTAIQTDDYTNIYVWSVLSILSALGIVWTVMFKRRKKDNKTI